MRGRDQEGDVVRGRNDDLASERWLCMTGEIQGIAHGYFYTTGNQYFAECALFAEWQKSHTRQRGSLPSVCPRGTRQSINTRQTTLCRVPGTGQRITLGKSCLCRVSGTRQRATLGKALDGLTPSMPVIFVECLPFGTRQRFFLIFASNFFVAFTWHHDEHIQI